MTGLALGDSGRVVAAPRSPAVLEGSAELVAEIELGHLPGPWGTSFMAFCDENRRHVLWSARSLDELRRVMVSITDGPWVELCAGDGRLAGDLRQRGMAITATDVRRGSQVHVLDVRFDLLAPRWKAALCVFPPDDDQIISALSQLSERIPMIIVVPMLDGIVTAAAVVERTPARVERLKGLEAELISRHDFCMSAGDARSIRRHAKAFVTHPSRGA